MPKNIKINLADCLGTSNKCGKVDEQRIWEFQRRLETLEAKPDNDNQLLSLTDNKLSITNGNEVTIPVYDDTKLTEKVKELESRPQGSNQTLSLDGNVLSISGGNSVTLKELDASIRNDLKNYVDSKEDKDTIYDDTQVRELIKGNSDKVNKVSQDLISVDNRVSNAEGNITNLTETTSNNSKEIEALKNKTDVFVSDMSFSREGDEVTLKYTRTDGVEKSVSFTDKNTTMVAYDDEPLKARVTALENKPDSDKQTLTLNGDTLSISNGNSVKVPQMIQWYPHIAWAEEINPVKNFTTRTSVSAPSGVGFYANYVGFCYTTEKEDPQEPLKYRWTRVSQVTELEKQLEELKKNGLTSTPQTLSIEGNTLTISEGNSVELPTSTNKELEKVVENLKPLSNNISLEIITYSGHSLYINKIGDFVHLTFDSYAVRNIYELPKGFRPKFTQTAPLWHKETGEYVGKAVLEPNGNFDETLVDKFKALSYPLDSDPHDGTNIFENIHTLTMSYYIGG